MSYFCSKCKGTFDHAVKHATNRKKTIQYYYCNPCQNETTRKYYKKNQNKFYNVIRASEKRYPEKVIARAAVRTALQFNKLIRPEKCTRCGIRTIPHAHHEDYSKKLEVMWLCRACHALRHREIRLVAV